MSEKKRVSLSVRSLVERVLQSGDLSYGGASAFSLLFEGTAAHRKHQSAQAADYEAEVPLACEFESEFVRLTLQGRADGIAHEDGRQIVEEIKSIHCDFSLVEAGRPEHWAQALIYASILCEERHLDAMGVRLVYIKLPEFETHTLELSPTLSELRAERERLLALWFQEADALAEHEMRRNAALSGMDFCFDAYRPGQRHMAAEVFKSLRDGSSCLLEAPTGIGKTAAALFGALKALSSGHAEKIFYLAPRSTIKAVANETLDRFAGTPDFPLRRLTLTAKEKCCPQEDKNCDPVLCPYAQGFFDRLPEALHEAESIYKLDEPAIRGLAERHQLCPFELSLALAELSDVVICDYNYVFDPRVRLQRFFTEGGDYALLVDEAHQLVDRAREMYSARLSRTDVKRLRDLLPKGRAAGAMKSVKKNVTQFYDLFRDFGKQLGDSEAFSPAVPSPELKSVCQSFCEAALSLLGTQSMPWSAALANLYFRCRDYLNAEKTFDERFRFLITKEEHTIKATILCADPSQRLKEALKKVRGAAFYSATLSPESYFRRLLGQEEASFTRYPSPFSSDQLRVWVRTDLPTTYRLREESAEAVARTIHTFVSGRTGHYMVFFPSYRYLRSVLEIFREAYPDCPVWAQETDMREDERLDYLEAFRSGTEQMLVGFVVMGGFFAEGIDLAGESLIGAVIVGVGLPQLNPERDLIRDYHADMEEPGFAYAYQYPGFIRVQQAAGRLIRTETDRGALLLIDPRFVRPDYLELMPLSWFPFNAVEYDEALSTQLREFWNGNDDSSRRRKSHPALS